MQRSYSELRHEGDITALALRPGPADHVQGRLVLGRGEDGGHLQMAVYVISTRLLEIISNRFWWICKKSGETAISDV
jgi:hypothetical protein